jgi:hypothetical protein
METAKQFAERIDALVSERKFDQAKAHAKEAGREDVVESVTEIEAKINAETLLARAAEIEAAITSGKPKVEAPAERIELDDKGRKWRLINGNPRPVGFTWINGVPPPPEVTKKVAVAPEPKLADKPGVREFVKAQSEAMGEKPKINFHASDKKPPKVAPPTIEDKRRALEELADKRKTDPLAYAEGRREWADKLCTTVKAIDEAVKLVLDRRADDGEQSQVTRIVAIGMSNKVKLWHSPEWVGHASVMKDGRWENYRIGSRDFDQWIRSEYGQQNQVKVGDQWVPQAPGSQAIRDAVGQLEGIAKYNGELRKAAIRVGGTSLCPARRAV